MLDVGADTRTGVTVLEYHCDASFKFTGTIDGFTFNLEPLELPAEECEQMREFVARASHWRWAR